MRRWSIPLFALLLSGFALPVIAQASLADCDADEFATTLSPAANSPSATAVWIDQRRLLWPGQPNGRYRLYHAAGGRMNAAVGQQVAGADAVLELREDNEPLNESDAAAFAYLGDSLRLTLVEGSLAGRPDWLRGQTLIVREDVEGRVEAAASLQIGALLDDLFAGSAEAAALGAIPATEKTTFALWAPTARRVDLCVYGGADKAATTRAAMQPDGGSGIWRTSLDGDLHGRYYRFLIEIYVPGTGWVLNRVTDPYSVSLSADSRRSQVLDLRRTDTMPEGWQEAPRPSPAKHAVDAVLYELHVRDFSVADSSVPEADQGNYAAFAHADTDGMRHLKALAEAGITDLHLMPVFDIASIPEAGCVTPVIPQGEDPEAVQAAIAEVAGRDCYNWGYDPLHYGAPEGSYASDALHGEVRVRELRAAIQALHGIGLRVGMDVVYNHTPASGQALHSVLDRIVPGYYQRLSPTGEVERSTCCANTATERRMMAKLMIDTAERWVRDYRIDAFRFDLMGHQPRAAVEQLQTAVDASAGRHIALMGEGWNFGEVQDGARFVQAAQGRLDGSGIGSFNDRARDAVRGGGCCDSGETLLQPGWSNGLADRDDTDAREELERRTDWIRAGLAASLRDFTFSGDDGVPRRLDEIDYKGQPAGFVSEPDEVVNYVSNHDNLTLFDNNVFKLPTNSSAMDRAHAQLLAAAVVAFGQGIAYFHSGIELLRSKSLDRNSFDSGDAFNHIDWTLGDNGFGIGLPSANDNTSSWPQMRPLIADPDIKPSAAAIRWMHAAFLDLLRIRASTRLLRLPDADAIRSRLSFPKPLGESPPGVIVERLDGRGMEGAGFSELLLLFNPAADAATLRLPGFCGMPWRLHPVMASGSAADQRPRTEAHYDRASGQFRIPARSALVYVIPPNLKDDRATGCGSKADGDDQA
ncbi:MAG: alpha-1,6-glucosidase domain-containing protein [Lysobacteraceae bacterium]